MEFSSLESIDKIQFEPEESKFIPKFRNVDYMIQEIVDKLDDLSKVDEDEIKDIIKRQHKFILNYDNFLSNARGFAQRLFMNKKFLTCLLDVIGTLVLDKEQIICINKLCYDYLRLSKGSKDQEVLDIMMSISYYINNNLVIRLSAELPIKESRLLAMIANSAFKLEKNIHRVNWFLTWVLQEDYNFTNIYLILYDHMMYPIIYTLLDVDNNISNYPIPKKNYDKISATILTLLLCMTSSDIYKVLTNYGYIWTLYGKPDTRIKFKELPDVEQFSRLKSVILKIDLGPYDDIEIP